MANTPQSGLKAIPTLEDVPVLDGVPPALVSFLLRLEAKFEARFEELEDQIRSVGNRVEDVQKSIRKMRRSSGHDSHSHISVTTHSQPLLAQKSADSIPSRSRTRPTPIKPSELSVSIPDLGELTGGSDGSSPLTPKHSPKFSPKPKLDLEEIYTPEQLVDVAKGAHVLQHYFRNAIEVRNLAQMKEMAEERTFVARELYETEINYVHTLVTIQTVFMEPLTTAVETGKPIISKLEIRELFGPIPVFYGVNAEFLKVLTPLMAKWDPVTTQLGVVFLKNVAQFLKVYGAHIDTYSNQFNNIKAMLARNADFARFVAEAEQKPECKMQDLPLMMLTVVQRITRYKILLSALQKATWPEHVDYPNLVLANQKITETTMLVNEKKRESESMKRLLEIQSLLHATDDMALVAPHRRYIGEIQGTWHPKRKQMIIYLFNDSLLITSVSKTTGTHKLKQFCGLEGCRMSMDSEPRRIRIDAPLNHYVFEADDITKKTSMIDLFNGAKTALRTKLVSSDTVNPRAMFNISHSSGNASETILSSYRRRPGSLPDFSEVSADTTTSSSPEPLSPPLSMRSSGSSKSLKKTPSSEVIPLNLPPDTPPSSKSKMSRSASKSERLNRTPPNRHNTDLPIKR